MRSYTEIPGFEYLLLEESWVLDVEAHPSRLTIRLDLVLTSEHSDYTFPKEGEQFCYRIGTIYFREVERLLWSGQIFKPARDASGEIDFGHIDKFEWNSKEIHLSGDFGSIQLLAKNVSVALEPEE